MDNNLLEAQAYSNAVSRLNYPSYGYGYGTREAFDGTVTNANLTANRQFGAFANEVLREGQTQIVDRISESGQNVLNIVQNRALIDQLQGFRDYVASSFNSNERRLSDIAMQNAQCCCDIKSSVAEVRAMVDCGQKVQEAKESAKQSALIEQLLAENCRRGNGNGNG